MRNLTQLPEIRKMAKLPKMSLMDGRPAPRYERLADDLEQRIRSGEFAPGERLPSEPALCEEYEVSDTTVRRALGILRDRGLVITEWGIGSRVRSPDDGE